MNDPPEPVVFWMGSCVQGAVSKGSPGQAENVGLFMQWRSLVCGDEALHVDHSPQSDHSTGPPEHEGTVVLMASLLIVCFFPVFLYIPVTVQPFSVASEIETPFMHLDFFGLQFGTTFETLLQSSL